ncbi:MAG: dethiobiotin synthase [Methylophilaceae bacterium]
MTRAYFITGTDTNVGKTYVSCGLLRTFAAEGRSVIGMKPIAAGCELVGELLVNDDVRQLQAASNIKAALTDINPYAFVPPIAPHIAAQQASVEIEFAPIVQAFKRLQQQAEVVIVEGVGGFCVPLNAHQDSADLAVALGLPVILVVALRLGCLNHALLTVQAIHQRGLTLAGWVANDIGDGMLAQAENISALQQRINAPLIAQLPAQITADSAYFSLAKIL